MNLDKVNIAVIGQGYVSLPLAIEFGKKYPESIVFDLKGFLPRSLVNYRL